MNGGLLLELDLLYFFLPLLFFMRHHSKRCLSVFLNYYISIRILYSIALCSASVFHSSQVGVIHLYCSHVDCRDQHYHNIAKVLFIQLFHNKNTNYIPPFEHHHQIHMSLSDQPTISILNILCPIPAKFGMQNSVPSLRFTFLANHNLHKSSYRLAIFLGSRTFNLQILVTSMTEGS